MCEKNKDKSLGWQLEVAFPSQGKKEVGLPDPLPLARKTALTVIALHTIYFVQNNS